MIHSIKIIIIGVLATTVFSLHAQQTFSAVSRNSKSKYGQVFYTIGQVFYTSNSSSEGSVTGGVQQAYEIITTIGVENKNINLSYSVYPNPTSNYLNLKVSEFNNYNLSYHLIDIDGKILESKKILNSITNISLENYTSSIFSLRIENKNKVIKVFKVLKK